MGIVFIHLMAPAAAFAGSAVGDVAIFYRPIDLRLLQLSRKLVLYSLAFSWITCLSIIAIYFDLSPSALIYFPKIMAKLLIVLLLSANGFMLHYIAFPRLEAFANDCCGGGADCPLVLGAVCPGTGLFAMFIGVSKVAAPLLGSTGYMFLYVLVVFGAIIVALLFVKPLLQRAADKNSKCLSTQHASKIELELPSISQLKSALQNILTNDISEKTMQSGANIPDFLGCAFQATRHGTCRPHQPAQPRALNHGRGSRPAVTSVKGERVQSDAWRIGSPCGRDQDGALAV